MGLRLVILVLDYKLIELAKFLRGSDKPAPSCIHDRTLAEVVFSNRHGMTRAYSNWT